MASNNYLEGFLNKIKGLLDVQMFKKVHQFARSYAGGKAKKKPGDLLLKQDIDGHTHPIPSGGETGISQITREGHIHSTPDGDVTGEAVDPGPDHFHVMPNGEETGPPIEPTNKEQKFSGVQVYKIHEAYTKEMLDHFRKRTGEHIDMVKANMVKLDGFKGLTKKQLEDRGTSHDLSKFSKEEHDPYVWSDEFHRCKNKGLDFEYPNGIKELVKKATKFHIVNNAHHPESHNDLNKMSDMDIVEMVSDWTAMAQELGEAGGSAKDWADKKVGTKFNFNKEKKELIYETIANLDELNEVKKQDSMETQSIIFSKDNFTEAQVIKWAKDHDKKFSKVDETENSFRLRQAEPNLFRDGSFKNKDIGDGVTLVLAKLVKEKEESAEKQFSQIFKAHDSEQKAWCIVLEPMTDVTPNGDTHGDTMTVEEIEKTAHTFAQNGMVIDFRHNGKPLKGVSTIESGIHRGPDFEFENAVGKKEIMKSGTWFVGIHAADKKVWKALKSGKLGGVSPGGFGKRREM